MYAVVEIAGKQFKVEEQQSIFVHRLAAEEGDTVAFDRVLLVDNNGNTRVGMPVLEGSSVKATVLSHVKGDKVLIFKKKRRKGYQKMNGHRQQLTEILIQAVLGKGEKLSDADAKLEAVSILTLKERSRNKPAKKVWNTPVTEAAEEVVEEKPKKAAKKPATKKADGEKKAPAKKAAKKTTDE
jgi:large subunit ribosomal protein L21